VLDTSLLYNNEWKGCAKIFTDDELIKIDKTILESKHYAKNIHGEWMRYRDLLLSKTMYYCLLRPREACYLRFNDYDKEHHCFYIRGENNKEKKSRIVPIPKELNEFIAKYFSFPAWLWYNSQYLFPSFADRKKPISPERWKHINREKVLKPAGVYISPITPNRREKTSYTYRTTRAVEIAAKGHILELINILGHADMRTAMHYVTIARLIKIQPNYLELMRKAMGD
jgi:integrase